MNLTKGQALEKIKELEQYIGGYKDNGTMYFDPDNRQHLLHSEDKRNSLGIWEHDSDLNDFEYIDNDDYVGQACVSGDFDIKVDGEIKEYRDTTMYIRFR